MSGDGPFVYDELPYDAQPFPQSHPDRLATIAILFGMRPARVRGCRVLELGCAAGGNLVPMAEQLPESEFLGIDLSARQVAEGRALIGALGLGNIQLRHQSILDFDPGGGAFDYIICHGVYSWVPDEVREKILEICARHLAPQGVAFISYNTYPGWHARAAVRDMMLYHVRDLAGPAAQVAQARALVEFLSHAVPADDSAFGVTLRDEVKRLRPYGDSHLFHDYLEDANQPLYFHQFMERAARHDLQYLGESDVSAMLTSNFPKPVADTLDRISNDVVRTEQYMDFVRNRAFRQTLVCRRDVPLQRLLTPDRVTSLHVASPATPLASGRGHADTFQIPGGPTFTPGHALVTAAFHHLAETWRRSVSFDDLYAAACRRAGGGHDAGARQVLAADLLLGYTANAVELRTSPADFVTIPTATPKASRLAREQARQGRRVTSQRHEAVLLDDLSLRLVSLLDGESDRGALLEVVVGMAAAGALVVEQGGKPLSDAGALRAVLGPALDQALTSLARCALLVA
jgi:methyltransferase-like protein/2-polyprenyl-3-methyl-5-hydroxy-6-metoxy-1,4-benzoquinol methylase